MFSEDTEQRVIGISFLQIAFIFLSASLCEFGHQCRVQICGRMRETVCVPDFFACFRICISHSSLTNWPSLSDFLRGVRLRSQSSLNLYAEGYTYAHG